MDIQENVVHIAALVLLALLTPEDARARCEVSVQGNMQHAASLLSQGIPVVSVMHQFATFAIVSDLDPVYRDAVLVLIEQLDAEKVTMEAYEKAVRICVPLLTDIQT